MKSKCKIFAFISLLFVALPVYAQELPTPRSELEPDEIPIEDFFKAEVIAIEVNEERNIAGSLVPYQVVSVRLLDSAEQGLEVSIEHVGTITGGSQRVEIGDTLLITRIEYFGETEYHILDKYRVPSLVWAGIIFLLLVFAFSGFRGLGSVAGLIVGLIILTTFVVPQILEGHSPLIISIVGAVVIAVLSLYLAHGFSRRTGVALIGTIATLLVATGLAVGFVELTGLAGLGSEEAYFLQIDPRVAINLKGLLLGGILIGALGVLDDITTAQVAVVSELKLANPALSKRELYARGISVGREHIASLVNTLALAYVGASFPLLLYFALDSPQPLWVTFNSEFIAEEIVRTLVGSSALVLAVPLTTFLAAWFFGRENAS